MRFLLVLWIAAVIVSAASAFEGGPTLRTAGSGRGHVVVTFSPGDLTPGEIAVSTHDARGPGGTFLRADVRLLERVTAKTDPATGIAQYRTRKTLAPGTYYVAVSGFLQEPPPSCVPISSRCYERWSNVRRIVVRPTSP
jgi:hypothetical protein